MPQSLDTANVTLVDEILDKDLRSHERKLPHVIDDYLNDWLSDFFFTESGNFEKALLLTIVGTLCFLVIWYISKKSILVSMRKFAAKTKSEWDDILMNYNVFGLLSNIIPLWTVDFMAEIAYVNYSSFKHTVQNADQFITIVVIMIAVGRIIDASGDWLRTKPKLKDKPIKSWTQLGKIIAYIIFGIILISTLTGKNPTYLLTSLGALSAVVMLVFKDSILGFVGSIQLAVNDMVRIGDWVTMTKHQADGDVIDITLSSVKVQNFDNTITTIPTYSFISDSFTNWRGMTDSGGRRVKKSIFIASNTVRFIEDDELDHFENITLIKKYIKGREKEISDFNEDKAQDLSPLNGRKQTNLGVFRKYVESYLRNIDTVNDNMTLMVRQLQYTDQGIPLELYFFTKTKEWVIYEQVTSDVFEHIYAAIPLFGLKLHESPTGNDIKEGFAIGK